MWYFNFEGKIHCFIYIFFLNINVKHIKIISIVFIKNNEAKRYLAVSRPHDFH